ncbi:MAG: helix-turn-helix domain-containing protein [Solirubrobacteraceae bacterium]
MEDSFLTVDEVAQTLRLNPQTVRNWIDGGSLRAVRVGRRVRIRQSDLDELVQAGITTSEDLKEPNGAPAIDENLPERLWAELYARLSEAHAAKAKGNQASLDLGAALTWSGLRQPR